MTDGLSACGECKVRRDVGNGAGGWEGWGATGNMNKVDSNEVLKYCGNKETEECGQ